MRLKKRFLFILMILLVLLVSVPVFASDKRIDSETDATVQSRNTGEKVLAVGEEGKMGSITIKLQDTSDSLSKKDVSLAFVQVAEVDGGEFKVKDTYEAADVDLNHIQSANELENAISKLSKVVKEKDRILITDENGVAKADYLPVGVYLIYGIDIKEYENISPSLVSVPTFDSESGQMDYDIEVLPKHTPILQQESRSFPKTGDNSGFFEYLLLGITFLVLVCTAVVIMKLSEKKKRG
ncbi:hypothetical protein MR857_11800 [bacterium]|nr:hypothetical protein [bacterium]MDY3021668.1 hypothetical protein [Oliverpabstia sp.]